MNFQEDKIYHIYNRGNNRQKIFFIDENYHFFLRKIQKELSPFASILAYCLMPNHFHLMVYVKPALTGLTTLSLSTRPTTWSRQTSANPNPHPLVRKIGTLLSSYTRAINIQENRTGSLFQQKTKSKCLNCEENRFSDTLTCLYYIHQNPLRAGLVDKLEDWPYSSFNEYIGKNNTGFCDKALIYQLLDIDPNNFYKDSSDAIDPRYLKKIW